MTGMQWTWAGADGSVWDLTFGPVRLDKRPVEGTGDPEWKRSTRAAAGRHGQRRTGKSLAQARDGFLPILLPEKDPAVRVATERAWWASWDSDVAGKLTVTQPDGSARTITAFFVDDGDYAPAKDPYTRGTDKLGVHWEADDVWWRGPAVTATFGQAVSGNFFGTTRVGPPFFISSSNVLATATLTNAGDIETPPLITVVGPATAFDFTVAGHRVAGAIATTAGQRLLLESDPARLAATLVAADGTRTDVTPQLAVADFARIPKKSTVPFTASLTGTGSVMVRHEPLYRRAW